MVTLPGVGAGVGEVVGDSVGVGLDAVVQASNPEIDNTNITATNIAV